MTDNYLFTPGPLTTSPTVKQAMLTDYGSRDENFITVIKEIRRELLQLANLSAVDYTAILMQGSGTFGIESVLTSTIKQNEKVLIIINGAYGKRMTQICQKAGVPFDTISFEEDQVPNLSQIEKSLDQDSSISHLALVHCETTTGILNPLPEISDLAKANKKTLIVDSMSIFGAINLDFSKINVDYLISSSNKCIEGVPGFSFVLANKTHLEQNKETARSLSLDLYHQWKGLDANGQFRFTPPTHSLLAFHQALNELKQEGGVAAREQRYKKNHDLLLRGMEELGFKSFLPTEKQAWIITTFCNPNDPNFVFEQFYQKLSEQGFIIYPGKLTQAPCFRIGNIGQIYPEQIKNLLITTKEILTEMQVSLPVK